MKKGIDALPRAIELRREGKAVHVLIIDQRQLPQELCFISIDTYEAMVDAIRSLALRGAPALGIAGASALVLYLSNQMHNTTTAENILSAINSVANKVKKSRPTAINLAWGIGLIQHHITRLIEEGSDLSEVIDASYNYVKQMEAQDEAANRSMGTYGASLLLGRSSILTHCNAGSLATVFYGTALGAIYTAYEQDKIEHVYIDETRPVGQGARLTAWELGRVGVPSTLICDNMAASLMAQGKIDAVFVGSDRVSGNGDVANKIGTYGLAVLANFHSIPFYVFTPTSTIDFSIESGQEIPIEQRPGEEISTCVPKGVAIYNPAFDITPASLITSIVTEKGIYLPSDLQQLKTN